MFRLGASNFLKWHASPQQLGFSPVAQPILYAQITKTSTRDRLGTLPSNSVRHNARARTFHSTRASRFLHDAKPQSQITYSIAAAFSAKGHKFEASKQVYAFDGLNDSRVSSEATGGKRDDKHRHRSGQDAFFISKVDKTGAFAFGVVDGVGGWDTSGIDPADFAHGLCDNMASAANGFPKDFSGEQLRPKELLDVGYQQVMNDKRIFVGGSTACIATAEPTGQLEVANLGDSGFVHIGRGAVRYLSTPQTHAFNTPYQLSKYPRQMLAQMAIFGNSKPLSEVPADANVTTHKVQNGDILIFATDGVWDNLSSEEILTLVSRQMRSSGAWQDSPEGIMVGKKLKTKVASNGVNPTETLQAALAIAMTTEAKAASLNPKRDGPFAKEVQRLYPSENWRGGKPDDICTVVAVAVEKDM